MVFSQVILLFLILIRNYTFYCNIKVTVIGSVTYLLSLGTHSWEVKGESAFSDWSGVLRLTAVIAAVQVFSIFLLT